MFFLRLPSPRAISLFPYVSSRLFVLYIPMHQISFIDFPLANKPFSTATCILFSLPFHLIFFFLIIYIQWWNENGKRRAFEMEPKSKQENQDCVAEKECNMNLNLNSLIYIYSPPPTQQKMEKNPTNHHCNLCLQAEVNGNWKENRFRFSIRACGNENERKVNRMKKSM